jgi:hypothetical protein
MDKESKSFDWKAFSRKTWVVVVSGIFLPPIGIILAWLKPDWSQKTKWIATGLMGLLLIGRFNASTDEISEEPGRASQVSGEKESSGQRTDAEKAVGGAARQRDNIKEVSEANEASRQVVTQQEAGKPYDGSAELPTGLTSAKGVKVGPNFSRKELREIAGRFIQNEIQPGWTLDRVLAVMGKPSNFSRTNGFAGQTPEQQKQFLEEPLIPPSVKRQMQKELVICTWSEKEDPDSLFIMLGFEDGVLGEGDTFITIKLAK